MSRTHLRPYLYLAAGVLLQGLSPVLTKLLLGDLTASAVVTGRYLIAVLFLLPFGWRQVPGDEAHPRPRRKDWVALVLVGGLGSGLATLLFTQAIALTSAGIANALSKTAPIFVAVLAYLTLRERITSARLLLVLVMVGADLLIGAGELRLGDVAGTRLWGDLLAIAAGALRAVSEVLGKASLRRFYPSTVALWRFAIGFAVAGTIALVTGDYRALFGLSPRAWLLLLALGGLCTSLSMSLYYRGLRDIPAHVAVSLRLTGAIVTVILSWLILDESLNALHLAGIAALVAGSYVIIVRATRHQPAAVPVVEAPAQQRPRLLPTLRARVAFLVSAMVAITVLGTTILSVRHNRAAINEQVRLTMVETASIILQLRGVAQAPSPETYRQYLDRILHHRIPGRFYSVEIMYLIVQDGQGNLIAWAKRDEVLVDDTAGRPLMRLDMVTGLRLSQVVQSGELPRQQDIIPLSAELERGGQPIGVIRMGCKRALATRAAAEIALRNLTLAILLVVLGIGVSYHLVGRLARPLERLTAVAGRIASGELDAPLLPQGGAEIESLGFSVGRMVEAMRLGRLLQAGVAERICRREAAAPSPFHGQVALLARFDGTDADACRPQLEGLLLAVVRHEGQYAGAGPDHVLVGFGDEVLEQDDVLRATLAAMEWQEAGGSGGGEGLLALVALPDPEATMEGLLADLSARLRQAAPALAGPAVLLAATAWDEVEAYLPTEPVGDTGLYRVLTPDAEGAAATEREAD